MSNIYTSVSGKRLPSVTTVIDVLGFSKRSLIIWANAVGLDGLDADIARAEAFADGARAHEWIAYTLLTGGREASPDALDRAGAAWRAYCAWRDWSREKDLEIVAIETPIVSSVLRVGGTPDLIAREITKDRGDRLCVFDWKTTGSKDGENPKPAYLEHWVQAAAYAAIYQEETGDVIDDLVIVTLDKNKGIATEHRLEVTSDQGMAALTIFKHARELYDLQKIVTQKTKKEEE